MSIATRPSSLDELETAAEDDKCLQPYSSLTRGSPSDAVSIFSDIRRAGKRLLQNSETLAQSKYEDDAADLERGKSKLTGDPDFRQATTKKVEAMVNDLETLRGIIKSRYDAYSQRPPIPGAVPRYQVKRPKTGLFRKSKPPRLASHLARRSGSTLDDSDDDKVAGNSGSENYIGNIVSLISSWERRGFLLAQGADSQALLRNDTEILSCLTRLISSPDARRAVLNLQLREAQTFLEAIHDTLARGISTHSGYDNKARRLMFKLSETHDILPASLFITGVQSRTEHPLHAGGYGDIYKASYEGKVVALKRIRMFTGEVSTEQRSKFCREALLWQSLKNEFIHPLLGIDEHSFVSTYCMISPWMEHGTVLRYLTEHGRSRGVLSRFLLQIAQGMRYLHSKSIVHGDLRGANILIAPSSSSSSDVHACLTDFGLAKVIMGDGETATGLASSSSTAGNLRWFAPELLSPQAFGCAKFARTRATDVYAFACVCVELHTLSPPFAKTVDPAVILKVINGERPERPVGMSEGVWQVASKGWVAKWEDRLGTEDIIRRLQAELTEFSV